MEFDDSKSALTPTPAVYATDRSKAVVLVLFLFFVLLCGFSTGYFMLSLFLLFVLVLLFFSSPV